MCVWLARIQVRVLVATLIMQALLHQETTYTTTNNHSSHLLRDCGGVYSVLQAASSQGGSGALVQLAEMGDRDLTAWPAPANGLCFAGVGYAPT
jgi:hypothetical protein